MSDTIDKKLLEELGIESHESEIIEEADDIIEETYLAMGVHECYTSTSNSALNIVIRNGKTGKDEISYSG